MAQLGKRLTCAACHGTVLVTKEGTGTPECCGVQMEEMKPAALPSSD